MIREFPRQSDDHESRASIAASSRAPLKDLKVPPRDAQIILGHANFTTTQQIYTHVDEVARLDALTRLLWMAMRSGT